MVDAVQLHYLLIHIHFEYIYCVEHIHMLWIGICVPPYTVTLLAKLTQIWVIWGWWDEIMTY
jgi:hypothetical protein